MGMIALFEADRYTYDSEEGKALIRQDLLQILNALGESLAEYYFRVGLERDDDWADLWIKGPEEVHAYVGCSREYLQSDWTEYEKLLGMGVEGASLKAHLYTFVKRYSDLGLLDFRGIVQKHQVGDQRVDFFRRFCPVFVDQKLLWSDGESAKTAPEIVDFVALNYVKQVELTLEAEAKHNFCQFLFREPSDHKNSGTT
jgi:hypothetical protein